MATPETPRRIQTTNEDVKQLQDSLHAWCREITVDIREIRESLSSTPTPVVTGNAQLAERLRIAEESISALLDA